jgi:hypothetical protein
MSVLSAAVAVALAFIPWPASAHLSVVRQLEHAEDPESSDRFGVAVPDENGGDGAVTVIQGTAGPFGNRQAGNVGALHGSSVTIGALNESGTYETPGSALVSRIPSTPGCGRLRGPGSSSLPHRIATRQSRRQPTQQLRRRHDGHNQLRWDGELGG